VFLTGFKSSRGENPFDAVRQVGLDRSVPAGSLRDLFPPPLRDLGAVRLNWFQNPFG
jgi:hypothetical protein